MNNEELKAFLEDNSYKVEYLENETIKKAGNNKNLLIDNEVKIIKQSKEWEELKKLLDQINEDKKKANKMARKMRIKLNALSFGYNGTGFFLSDDNAIREQAEKEYKRTIKEEKTKEIAKIIKAYELLN